MRAWEEVLRDPRVRLVRVGLHTEFAVELASGRTVEVLVTEGAESVEVEFDRGELFPWQVAELLAALGASPDDRARARGVTGTAAGPFAARFVLRRDARP